MAEHKTIHGILAMIDIVNFTGQSVNLGEKYTAQYTDYFQERIRALAGKHGENGFKVIKFLGDGALLFGQEPGSLLSWNSCWTCANGTNPKTNSDFFPGSG